MTIIKKSTPYIWFQELWRIPKELRDKTKDEGFVGTMKGFYHKRCQHAEDETKLCEKCQKPKNGYRLTQSQNLVRNIQEFEQANSSVQELVDVTLKRHEILEVRYANEDNLIFELTNRNFYHLKRSINNFFERLRSEENN